MRRAASLKKLMSGWVLKAMTPTWTLVSTSSRTLAVKWRASPVRWCRTMTSVMMARRPSMSSSSRGPRGSSITMTAAWVSAKGHSTYVAIRPSVSALQLTGPARMGMRFRTTGAHVRVADGEEDVAAKTGGWLEPAILTALLVASQT